MRHIPATPSRTLSRARTIAMEAGIRYVYTGNVYDPEGGTTFCPTCATPVIRRDRYVIDSYALDDHGCCTVCGTRIPGRFNAHSRQWTPADAAPDHDPLTCRGSGSPLVE